MITTSASASFEVSMYSVRNLYAFNSRWARSYKLPPHWWPRHFVFTIKKPVIGYWVCLHRLTDNRCFQSGIFVTNCDQLSLIWATTKKAFGEFGNRITYSYNLTKTRQLFRVESIESHAIGTTMQTNARCNCERIRGGAAAVPLHALTSTGWTPKGLLTSEDYEAEEIARHAPMRRAINFCATLQWNVLPVVMTSLRIGKWAKTNSGRGNKQKIKAVKPDLINLCHIKQKEKT